MNNLNSNNQKYNKYQIKKFKNQLTHIEDSLNKKKKFWYIENQIQNLLGQKVKKNKQVIKNRI